METPSTPAETPENQENQGSRQLQQMQQQGLLSPANRAALEPVAERFGVAITPHMAGRIDLQNPADPVAAQFVPDARELRLQTGELSDPIGDHRHMPVKGIIHRYPDRVLFTPVHVCPVYCRFCFRREDVGSQPLLSEAELAAALDYIRQDPGIWEVILSGGDPLVLSPRRLQQLLTELRTIDHVKVIRIHTRVPVVSPERVTAELIDVLRTAQPLYIVLHTNHVQEFDEQAVRTCHALADAGLPLLSQTVLLKDINDSADTLETLFRFLIENRIRPYYLHHADQARGTAHFRTTLAEGQAITDELRGRISGLCQPQYVIDIPGGHGKSPAGSNWVSASGNGYRIRDYTGSEHYFADNTAEEVTQTRAKA